LCLAEAENNLILGVALASRGNRVAREHAYWATVMSGDAVVGCAIRTPPQPLVVSRLPPTAIQPLVEDVGEVFPTPPGINGPKDEAEALALAWASRHGVAWRVRMRLQIHSLTEPRRVPDPPQGGLRRARAEDVSLARAWVDAYVRDTGIAPPTVDVAAAMIEQGRLFLWIEDGEPRTMAAAGRDTTTGCAIHSVYTPPHLRRRGYATAAVGKLGDELLKSGRRFCCLYTDAANPTSNSIYAKLGYRRVRDDAEVAFEASDSS
jgi:GNAT superfamily N-acetyltransferase